MNKINISHNELLKRAMLPKYRCRMERCIFNSSSITIRENTDVTLSNVCLVVEHHKDCENYNKKIGECKFISDYLTVLESCMAERFSVCYLICCKLNEGVNEDLYNPEEVFKTD